MSGDESSECSLARRVGNFIASCREPAFLEPGEPPLPLIADSFVVASHGQAVVIEVWFGPRNLCRRIVGVGLSRPGRLDLVTERFGKRRGKAQLLDQSRPSNATASEAGRRRVFRERFRQFLRRQFPGWRLSRLTTEADLERSLSPSYPRALLVRGGQAWAAIGASRENENPSSALTFGLIWLDYVRRNEQRLCIQGLVLLLPDATQNATCLRLRFLDARLARFLVFVYNADGFEQQIDPHDHGNLDTRLEGWGDDPNPAAEFEELLSIAGVQVVPLGRAGQSLRVHGYEFARQRGGRFEVHFDGRRSSAAANPSEITALARELARIRSHDATDRDNLLFTRYPEAWLESQVRSSLPIIDPRLREKPVYGQVPAFTAGERGVLDLLAADHTGRLTVLELKATSDLHLPLQALDYWMRVAHHLAAGDFPRSGYFPGIALSCLPPRLLLVAPALEYHPTTETILRFFSPSVPVERIGLNSDWRRWLQVVFRTLGARRPGM